MSIKLYAIILALAFIGCQSKKEKLSKAIYQLEVSDSSATPHGMNELADMYYSFSEAYPKDSISEKFLFKGFMFKYLTSRWDEAIKFANFYKASYANSEYFDNVNLKLADIYYSGKKNLDSSAKYYLASEGKAQFSADEYRKAGYVLTKWASKESNNDKKPLSLFVAAKCYQLAGVFDTALVLYAQIAEVYPTFNRSPDALNTAGFICWNDLKKTEEAKVYYKRLVEKYPDHPLAKDAKLIVEEDILGMTDLELSEYLMKKNKDKGTVQ